MKIAAMGSGGIGGYFGARLAQGGADVTFIARGAHLEAMRSNGLRIEAAAGSATVSPVSATDDPRSVGEVDLVLLCVKLWDTDTALAQIRPMVGARTTVVSFQNGVLKDDLLRAAFPQEQLIGGVSYIATRIARPGVIEQTGQMQRLVFGEYDGRTTPRVQALLQACLRGGINAEISADIRRAIWEKYVFLVGLSGATATMHTTIGPIRSHPRTRAFLRDLMQEVVAVGRARGIDLPADYADMRLRLADEVSPDMTSSMHHDLERGGRLELRWLAGGVVEMGEQAGVPTPLNRAVYDILCLRADGAPNPA